MIFFIVTEKNYPLAEDAVKKINSSMLEILVVKDVPAERMTDYINASDVVLLTSVYEGSPNIIKEAMACNRPIVSTDVGDVSELLEDVDACHIADNSAVDMSEWIRVAMEEKSSNGRQKLLVSGLNSNTIAEKLINLYSRLV